MNNNTESSSEMFGPLVFENIHPKALSDMNGEISCLLCDKISLQLAAFVKHIFEDHNLVIEDVQNIDNLSDYIQYWKEKFKASSMEEIVPAVKIAPESQVYYLLSSLLEEDKKLRQKLRLENVLKVQEFERTDTGYTKSCLFCKLLFKGTRSEFVNHLVSQHNLQLGNSQNLVYIEELIATIERTINNLICIYCNRVFPERNVLKEHMRKKLHKRLNRHNKDYDKYFIINYLEPKTKKGYRNDDQSLLPDEEETNKDEEYYDWNEKEDSIKCLFCEKNETNINTLCLHMEADHEFDFSDQTRDLDFYQKVKLVNYIRKRTHNKKCFYCDQGCTTAELLTAHLYEEEHCKLPKKENFDQPEFYFPTYENDSLLYLIDDVED